MTRATVKGPAYTAAPAQSDAARRGKGGRVSLKHAALLAALAACAIPSLARAQECTAEEPGCDAGGPCPLKALPYEEFIAAPPVSRGGRSIPPVAERPFDPEAGDRILIKGFRVEGVKDNPDYGVTQQTVQAAADAAFLQESGGAPEARLTVGRMVRVSDAVTTFYRSQGYIVAKAFLPAQDIGTDSIVRIQVLEGRIAEVVVEGNKSYSSKVLGKPSAELVGGTPVRGDVETALLYTQDYPGVQLFGTFRPGTTLGDTRLVLQVLNEDHFGFQFGLDNYGTEFTGEYRARLDAAWKNPLGLGDELDLSVLQSAAPENTTYGSVMYRAPFGPRGFGGFVEGNTNAFAVDEPPFDQLQLEGTITTYRGGLDWRYARGRFSNARVALSYERRTSELTGLGGLPIADDQYNVVQLDSSLDRIDLRFRGVDQVSTKIRHGTGGEFGSASGLKETFTILGASYTRVQALAETQTMVFRFRGQSVDTPVSPLEQFGLAGPDAVRAYPVGQILKDIGLFLSGEYQVQAPGFARAQGPFGRAWGDLLQFSLFADYGKGLGADATNVDSDEISGAGVGIRFGIPGSFQFLVEGAQPLSSEEASDGKSSRVYGSLSIRF